jgi:hypothetical protein
MSSDSINLRLSSSGYLALEFLSEDVNYLSKSGGIFIANLTLNQAEDILSTWELYEGMHGDLDSPESEWFKRFDIDIRVLRGQIDRCKRKQQQQPKFISKSESANTKHSGSSPSKPHTKSKSTHVSSTAKSYHPRLEDFEYDPRVYEIGELKTAELRRKRLVQVAFDKIENRVLERNRDSVIAKIKDSLPSISTHGLNGHGEIAMQLYRAERAAAEAAENRG